MPSPAFRDVARREIDDPRAEFVEGDAETLPLANGEVDLLVSAFALNFVPDPAAALRED